MINQLKSNIPRQQRHWYTYDSTSHNAKAIDYNYQTGIDTVYISIKLSKEHYQYIVSNYKPIPLFKKGFRNMVHQEGISVLYDMIDHNKYLNAQIQIQTKVKDLVYGQLYYDVMDFLKSDYHYISRMDFYIDYAIPRLHSVTYKRHGNQSMDNYDSSNWIGNSGNTRKTVLLSHYTYSKCHNVKKLHDNRIEYKLHFTYKHQMRFDNINKELIANWLSQELLVLDYQSIDSFTDDEKKLLTDSKKVKKVEIRGKSKQVDFIKESLNQAERTKLRQKVKKNRVKVEEIFLASFPHLFDWLDDTTSVADTVDPIDIPLLSALDIDLASLSPAIDELL